VHLVELSVMEQRYQAVMAVVQDGWKITEVADRLGVTRQAVHKWIARYGKRPVNAGRHVLSMLGGTLYARSPSPLRNWGTIHDGGASAAAGSGKLGSPF
jgi:transposase